MEIADAILELAKQVGRIADGGGYTPPPDGEPPVEPPVDPYAQTWRLKSRFEIFGKPNFAAIALRTPNTQDKNKIQINFRAGETVTEAKPPRTVYEDGGTSIWKTEADFDNVLANWAYLPNQPVFNDNNVSKMLLDFPRGKGGTGKFGTGCFIERIYLKKQA